MSEENEEQSFEDAFNELAGDSSPPPIDANEGTEPTEDAAQEPIQESGQVNDEGDIDAVSEGQEEKEEEQAVLALEPAETTDQAGESASLEDQLAESQKELQQWKHKYNSDLGRQSAFQRQLRERDEQIAQLQSSQTPNPGVTPEKWATIKQDYPDIAEGFIAFVDEKDKQHAAQIKALEQRLEPLHMQLHDSFVQNQFQQLASEHPDYQEVAASPEFNQWLQAQPHNIQGMLTSEQSGDAAFLLRSFKNETMPKQSPEALPQDSSGLKQRREKQLQLAQNVPSRGGRSQPSVPPESDFNAAFDYFVDRDER